MKEVVVAAYGRSAIGKAPKGALKDTRPDDLMAQVIRGVMAKVPQFDPALLDDVILGCAFPEAEQGKNVARYAALAAGIPDSVPAQTVNRYCASGLQSIAAGANAILAGQAKAVLAGGVESMSTVPMGGNFCAPNVELMERYPEAYVSMGITAENVAALYGITREAQDEFSLQSHLRAAAAQREGRFAEEIVPVNANVVRCDDRGIPARSQRIFDQDEGIRANISAEALGKLRPVFQMNGTVTAGNASQTSDGAAVVLLMERGLAEELGLKILGRFVSFASSGVAPERMGLGPVKAIPKALALAGLTVADMDLIELNEAFAAQSLACIQELGLDREKTNVNGGAIALGHPLGCTGAFLTIKLLSEMHRRRSRYGLVSMCIGGGMGAAAVFERV